ncbi:MAG: hypothetical protein ACQCN3_02670 [Candidatus Bathyarchaeia archaeon]|jgi:hypothetical protein
MKNCLPEKQQVNRNFVLTIDMVPIHYTDRDFEGYSNKSVGFVCPLPKGYQRVIKECPEWLRTETNRIITEVEKESNRLKGEFTNLLIEYSERSVKQCKQLKRIFAFSHILFSEGRGLFGITAGGDCNSGDIYLSTDSDCSTYYAFSSDGFKKFFEPHNAWHCHNVDFYWQALKDRAVVVRYFNLLQKKLAELESVGGNA